MTLSDSITHLATVSMASSATAPKAGMPAPALFKNAAVTNYGPDGVQPATTATLSLDNVKLAADGSIAGGQISHATTTPDHKPVFATTLQLAAGGKLTQAEAKVYNRNDAGLAKVVSADLTGIQWTDSGKLGSGEIQLLTKHPVTRAQTASGKMLFQNEKLVSGSVTHYSAQNPQAVESLTEMDYRGLNFLGSKIAGGQLKVTRKQPDQTVSSNSQVSFHEDGSGRISQIQTANLDPKSGATKSQVTADYSGVAYDPRNVITSGDVHIHVVAPDQSPLSHAVVTFANAVPQSSQTWRFQGNVLTAKAVTDFSNAKFDDQNRVLSGSVKTDLYDRSEQLVASTVNSHQNGAIVDKKTQTFTPAVAAPTKSFQDVAAKWTPPPAAKSFSLAAAAQTVAAAQNAPPDAKKKLRRDGTLEEFVTTTTKSGAPISSQVTHYDTDGKTVVSSYQIDLSKVTPASGQAKVSGSVSIREFTGGVKLNSDSVFNY